MSLDWWKDWLSKAMKYNQENNVVRDNSNNPKTVFDDEEIRIAKLNTKLYRDENEERPSKFIH